MYWKRKAHFVVKKKRKGKGNKRQCSDSREYLETGIIYKTKYP